MKFYTALITVLALVTLAQCNVGDLVFDHFTDAAQYYLKLLNENCDEGGNSAQYQKLVEVSRKLRICNGYVAQLNFNFISFCSWSFYEES